MNHSFQVNIVLSKFESNTLILQLIGAIKKIKVQSFTQLIKPWQVSSRVQSTATLRLLVFIGLI